MSEAQVSFIGVLIFGIYYAKQKMSPILEFAYAFIVSDYSGLLNIYFNFERANVSNLPINENTPADLESLLSYL
ncbi:MAG: hypothetical protein R3A12_20005 [Ignavibacteria bacterium]